MPLSKTVVAAVLLAAAAFVFAGSPRGESVPSGTAALDPCASQAYMVNVPERCLVCPGGDGANAYDPWVAWVKLVDDEGNPMVGVPASDMWLSGCENTICLCYPTNVALTNTNNQGTATFGIGILKAGGKSSGFGFFAMGTALRDTSCAEKLCFSVVLISPDFNRDMSVDLIDLVQFADCYGSPPDPYDPDCDFNGDGMVELIDLSIFATHWAHECTPGLPCP